MAGIGREEGGPSVWLVGEPALRSGVGGWWSSTAAAGVKGLMPWRAAGLKGRPSPKAAGSMQEEAEREEEEEEG